MAKVSIKSEKITPFGGIFHVRELFSRYMAPIIDKVLGFRCTSYGYQYSEIVGSLSSVPFGRIYNPTVWNRGILNPSLYSMYSFFVPFAYYQAKDIVKNVGIQIFSFFSYTLQRMTKYKANGEGLQRTEQREPSSLLEWPSRDGRRRSQRTEQRALLLSLLHRLQGKANLFALHLLRSSAANPPERV